MSSGILAALARARPQQAALSLALRAFASAADGKALQELWMKKARKELKDKDPETLTRHTPDVSTCVPQCLPTASASALDPELNVFAVTGFAPITYTESGPTAGKALTPAQHLGGGDAAFAAVHAELEPLDRGIISLGPSFSPSPHHAHSQTGTTHVQGIPIKPVYTALDAHDGEAGGEVEVGTCTHSAACCRIVYVHAGRMGVRLAMWGFVLERHPHHPCPRVAYQTQPSLPAPTPAGLPQTMHDLIMMRTHTHVNTGSTSRTGVISTCHMSHTLPSCSSRVCSPTPGAHTRPCTHKSPGPSASMRGSRPRKRATRSTRKTWPLARKACLWRSTCPRTGVHECALFMHTHTCTRD